MSFQFQSPAGSPFGTQSSGKPKSQQQGTSYFPVASPPLNYGIDQQQARRLNPQAAAAAAPPQSQPANMQGYGQQYGQPAGYNGGGVDAVTQQMGQVGLNGTSQPQSQTRRKKDRHAYHQIETQNAPALSSPSAATPNDSQNDRTWQASAQPWQSQTLPAPGDHSQPQAGAPISMDTQRFPQSGPGVPGGAQSKVNPDQIPSVPLSRDAAAEYYKSHVYPTVDQRLPPPSTTPFVALDQGNASPKHARLTLNCIPNSHEQMHNTGLPLGIVLQPLAKQTEGEQAIPVLDFGDVGPPRCRRCRAYINPFMVFSNGGNKMTCNLCGHPNEVPSEYFAPTDPSGVRVDRAQRPELTLGTCEFLVPKEYWAKEPVPMRYLFLIDVSAEACTRGFLQGVCDGILAALYGDAGNAEGEDAETNGASDAKLSKIPAGAKVAFLAFDRDIHFYNVSASVSSPQQLVVSDLEDPFAAISPQYLFVDPNESRSNITTLLRGMPQMFFNIKAAEPALSPPLLAAIACLSETGGKIICSLNSLPSYGPGRLYFRDQGNVQNEDNDHNKILLRSEHPAFQKLQAEMVKAGVGVDFFLAAPAGGYLDIANIGNVAEKTGGEVFYYPNWAYPRDALRLQKEISHTVQREQGYAALMKVRCSNGLQVAHYSGNFTQHTFGADLELASISEDTGMSVTFSYDGKLDSKLDAHFQSALLYTTATGQRRVRCSNIAAQVTENAREAMRFVDQDAVITVMAKESVAKVPGQSFKDIRSALQDKTIEILSGYRKHFSGSHPTGQLVLPENLKELAMYVLGLMKSRAIKGGKEPSDRRIYDVRLVRGMGAAELSLYLYPRIIALHNLEPEEGFADETGQLKMPRSVRASFSQLEAGGAYLVDNGQILLLWLHAQVSPNLLEDLFGPGFNDLQRLDANMSALPTLETLLNAQARNILLHLEQQRGSKGLAIQLARQGFDGAEFEFARLLYEDRNGEASSYVDWLVQLHRGVGAEMSGSKSSGEDVSQTISNTISSITGSMPWS